jgi:hypothetical protein
MAKNRPPLELEGLSQTLKESKGKGVDAFFPSPPPRSDTETSKSPTPTKGEEQVTRAVSHDGNTDVTASVRQDVYLREWRDIIENTQTRGSSLRLTNEEAFAVEDVIQELERHLKIKTSLNEVARLGLLYIIDDFKKNREKSLIYKVKKS